MEKIIFNQVRNQNFYTAHTKTNYNNIFTNGVILKSYNTIVGFVNIDDGVLYRVRYTHTTGKQITQYAYNYDIKKEYYTTAEKLHDIILNYTGFDLNTEYNGAIAL